MEFEKFLGLVVQKSPEQLQDEIHSLLAFVNASTGYAPGTAERRWRLARAVMSLRDLMGVHRLELRNLFCSLDGFETDYAGINGIMDPEEYMRVPGLLEKFIRAAEHDICDDGWLRVIRANMSEQYPTKPAPRPFTRYFLSLDEWVEPVQVRNRLNEIRLSIYPIKVIGMKRMSFHADLDMFSEFIEILADPESWFGYFGEGVYSVLDNLMKPEKYEEWM